MSYIDILIPFLAGLLCVLSPGAIIKSEDAGFEAKKYRIKRVGYLLLAVAVIYGLIKFFTSK